jgi:hypothetical protein
MFPPAPDADVVIGMGKDILEFKISDLERFIEEGVDLDPQIIKAIVIIFHDLACEGFFEGE